MRAKSSLKTCLSGQFSLSIFFCIFVLFGVKSSGAGPIRFNNMVGRIARVHMLRIFVAVERPKLVSEGPQSYSNRRISRSRPVFFTKTKEDSFHKLVYHSISLLQISLVYYAVWCLQMPWRACHFSMPKVILGTAQCKFHCSVPLRNKICAPRYLTLEIRKEQD